MPQQYEYDIITTTVRKLAHENKTAFLALNEAVQMHPPPDALEHQKVQTMMLYNLTLMLEQFIAALETGPEVHPGSILDKEFPTAATLKEALEQRFMHATKKSEIANCKCSLCGNEHFSGLGI